MLINEKCLMIYRNKLLALQCNKHIFDPAELLAILLDDYKKLQLDESINALFIDPLLKHDKKLKKESEETRQDKEAKNAKHIAFNHLNPFIMSVIKAIRMNGIKIKCEKLAALFSAFFSTYNLYQAFLPDVIRFQWKLTDIHNNYFYQAIYHFPDNLPTHISIKFAKRYVGQLAKFSHCVLLGKLPTARIDQWVLNIMDIIDNAGRQHKKKIRDKIKAKLLPDLLMTELQHEFDLFLKSNQLRNAFTHLAPLISEEIYPNVRAFFTNALIRGDFKVNPWLGPFEPLLSNDDKQKILNSIFDLIKGERSDTKRSAYNFLLSHFHWLNNIEQEEAFNLLNENLSPLFFTQLVKLRPIAAKNWAMLLEEKIQECMEEITKQPISEHHVEYGKIHRIWHFLNKDEQEALVTVFVSHITHNDYYLANLYPLLKPEQQSICINILKTLRLKYAKDLRKTIKYDYNVLNEEEKNQLQTSLVDLLNLPSNASWHSQYRFIRKVGDMFNLPEDLIPGMINTIIKRDLVLENLPILSCLFRKCPFHLKQEAVKVVFDKLMKKKGDICLYNLNQLIREFNYEQSVYLLNYLQRFCTKKELYLTVLSSVLNRVNEDCSYNLIPSLNKTSFKHYCYRSLFFRNGLPIEVADYIQQFHPARPRWH